MVDALRSNMWKFFLYVLTHRRHWIIILSIYFLTLPNTQAQQIGFYSAIGSLAGLLLEIPSGYFADRFGHKRTLVLAKVLLMISTTAFIFAEGLWSFIAGAVFLSAAQAFFSGTDKAFMHETLSALGREHDYGRVMSKLGANVSLISVVLAFSLPFLTAISIRAPLVVGLAFDVIGVIVALSLVAPPQRLAAAVPWRALVTAVKKASSPGFYVVALFFGILGGFMFASSPYRSPYLQSLGLPLVLMGISSLSRFVWWVWGNYAHAVYDGVRLRSLMLIEILLFPACFVLVSFVSNPYVAAVIFALFVGYYWGRSEIVNHHLLGFVTDGRYRATLLSVQSQIKTLVEVVIAVAVGFIMQRSFALGHAAMGVALFVLLSATFVWGVRLIPESRGGPVR